MTDNRFPPRSVEDLLRMQTDDGAVKYLFFWGHQPSPGGGVGPGCMSQWWPVTFEAEGETYPTAEHFMMTAKARLFGDEEMARRILATPRPGAAKALGRQVRGFDEETWKRQRYDIVVRANLAKFGQHDDLRDFLLRTGHRVLVEASPIDLVWGIGLAATDQRAGRPAQWPGLNLLGFALMEVRAALAGQ